MILGVILRLGLSVSFWCVISYVQSLLRTWTDCMEPEVECDYSLLIIVYFTMVKIFTYLKIFKLFIEGSFFQNKYLLMLSTIL